MNYYFFFHWGFIEILVILVTLVTPPALLERWHTMAHTILV